ncbi:MAG: major capsid protein [Actinoallomurus sp.]
MQPGRADVHIDRPLSNLSIALRQSMEGFVADKVFPNVPVANSSNKYWVIPQAAWNRDQMKVRAPGTRAPSVNYTLSTDNYSCDVFDLSHYVTDEVRANADDQIQLDRNATELLVMQAMIRKERQWSGDFFTTSVWTGDQTGVNSASPGANQFGMWDRSDSQPIEVIRAQCDAMQARSGYRPNTLVLGRQVYSKLLDHPDIVGRIDRGQTQGAAMVLRQNLAALFEVDQVLVMEAIYNSANEGAAESEGFIGGKSALLLYVAPAPGLQVASAGYTFSWTGLLGGGNMAQVIRRFRLDPEHADMFEVQMAFDQKKTSADLGVFFATAIS